VVSLFRDKKRIEPVPRRGAIQSAQGIDAAGQRDADLSESPGRRRWMIGRAGDSLRRCSIRTLAAEAINVGITGSDRSAQWFEGTQKFEFADLGKSAKRHRANHTAGRGKFAGVLEKDFTFGKAQAVIDWSRPDRMLLHVDAQASISGGAAATSRIIA